MTNLNAEFFNLADKKRMWMTIWRNWNLEFNAVSFSGRNWIENWWNWMQRWRKWAGKPISIFGTDASLNQRIRSLALINAICHWASLETVFVCEGEGHNLLCHDIHGRRARGGVWGYCQAQHFVIPNKCSDDNELQWWGYTVRPNKKETRFSSKISSLLRKI